MTGCLFKNPFRPGPGHMPPHLAGRQKETEEFVRLLGQDVILENLVLTGLQGIGKTVLHDTFKPRAIHQGWGWVGTDLSESSSITEERLAERLMTDLAVVTSSLVLETDEYLTMGLRPEQKRISRRLDFQTMEELFDQTPGLVSDKLKAVLELVWQCMQREGQTGLIFAYDEAQNLSDHAAKDEYPLSLMLDVFQSIQKKEIPFMLVLVGLPTLFPKLVEARTFAERMFSVVILDLLNEEDSQDAIVKPIENIQWDDCAQREEFQARVALNKESIPLVIRDSGGYPYFIQFICRELYDVFLRKFDAGLRPRAPIEEILRKLDNDFYAGRWAQATDRQRELLTVIANLPTCESEFTLQEVVEKSRSLLRKPFGPSQVNQMLVALGNAGLVYKNRHGKYSFAVPLLGRFILRQQERHADH